MYTYIFMCIYIYVYVYIYNIFQVLYTYLEYLYRLYTYLEYLDDKINVYLFNHMYKFK